MSTKLLLYLIIVILGVFNIIFVGQQIIGKNTGIIDEKPARIENDKLKSVIDVMVENQNIQLNEKQIIIDEKFDTLFLSQLIDSPKLIFFFNEYSCMPCVNEAIVILNRKIKEVGKENIVILSYYNQPRDMYLFSRVNKLDIPICNLTSKLNVPTATTDIPFFFTTNKDLKVNNLLLIDPSLPELVENYISILVKKGFFKN